MLMEDHTEDGVFEVSINGERYLVPLHCPHRAGRLKHGEINQRSKTISCPLHHSVFSLETGEQLRGPPCGRLAVTKCAPVEGPVE